MEYDLNIVKLWRIEQIGQETYDSHFTVVLFLNINGSNANRAFQTPW